MPDVVTVFDTELIPSPNTPFGAVELLLPEIVAVVNKALTLSPISTNPPHKIQKAEVVAYLAERPKIKIKC